MLGLRWKPTSDRLSYAAKLPDEGPVTKRSLLSLTAQLFDPLGWLTPVTIRAKIAIQSTWLLGLGWDDPLPEHEADQWRMFRTQLPRLSEIQIPRRLEKGSASAERELHGFADASERAYAAVLYLKIREKSSQVVLLVTAKSKVAPIKQVSLPRLELSAVLILARLVEYAFSVLDLPDTQVFLWTDSTVTLSWIKEHPSKWKTYVGPGGRHPAASS
jgi:hypothetical protein